MGSPDPNFYGSILYCRETPNRTHNHIAHALTRGERLRWKDVGSSGATSARAHTERLRAHTIKATHKATQQLSMDAFLSTAVLMRQPSVTTVAEPCTTAQHRHMHITLNDKRWR